MDTGDIEEHLPDETIREKIRDDYLRDSTVTILLLGQETKNRKHIDWEIYSSMYDGKVNKRSGILVINLPTITGEIQISHHKEDEKCYPDITNWVNISSRQRLEEVHPFLLDRIIDNSCKKDSPPKISITSWEKIYDNPEILRWLISATHRDKNLGEYDLSRLMKKK